MIRAALVALLLVAAAPARAALYDLSAELTEQGSALVELVSEENHDALVATFSSGDFGAVQLSGRLTVTETLYATLRWDAATTGVSGDYSLTGWMILRGWRPVDFGNQYPVALLEQINFYDDAAAVSTPSGERSFEIPIGEYDLFAIYVSQRPEGRFSLDFSAQPIPEPSSVVLAIIGGALVAWSVSRASAKGCGKSTFPQRLHGKT